jgi:hypothetical protein
MAWQEDCSVMRANRQIGIRHQVARCHFPKSRTASMIIMMMTVIGFI